MKKTLLMLLILSSITAMAEIHELKFTAKYRPNPENRYPRYSLQKVWRLDRLSFEGKQLDLDKICTQNEDKTETTCSGEIRDFEMSLYNGINIQTDGFGALLSLDIELDGKPYLKESIKVVENTFYGFAFNRKVKSDSGEFYWDPKHESYNWDEAPFIGGTIQNQGKDSPSLKMICLEKIYDECKSITFIEVEKNKRKYLTSQVFPISNLESIRKNKTEFVGNWFFPATASMGFMCVELFVPVTLAVDVVLLPVTVPISLVKKFRGKKAFRVLTDISRPRKITLGWTNYQQIKDLLKIMTRFP